MNVRRHFTDEDLEAVRDATRQAESRTAGEIVSVVVARCDDYEEALWKGALLGAVVAAVVAAGGHAWSGAWGGWPLAWIAAPVLTGAVVGALLVRLVPRLWRGLVPADVLDRRVAHRAAAAFVDEQVFATRDRTGVLLFLALFERRVEVRPDAGLKDSVPEEAWRAVADDLTRGIRAGRSGPALVEAIEACGRLLETHGPAARPDDEQELPDEPRLHDA